MARNQIAKKSIDGTKLSIEFQSDPVQVKSISLEQIPTELHSRLALHGLSQKVGDSFAGAKSVAEAIEEATAVIENLINGVWGREREAGEGNLLEQAIARLTGKTIVDISKKLETMSKDQVKELRKRADIVKAIGEIQAEKAAARAGETTPAALDSMF